MDGLGTPFRSTISTVTGRAEERRDCDLSKIGVICSYRWQAHRFGGNGKQWTRAA